MGKRFLIWTLRLDCIAVVKLTWAGTTWFLVVPKFSTKSGCLSLRYLITCSSTRCQAVLSLLGIVEECPFFVVKSSVCQWPCKSLLCSDPSSGGNKDAVIGNFPSLVLPFPVGLEKQCKEHCSTSVWGVVTLHNAKWGCVGHVALGGTQGLMLNRSTGAVTGSVTNCVFIPRYCVCLLPWCHCMCRVFSTISVLLALNCKSKQSKSHLQT